MRPQILAPRAWRCSGRRRSPDRIRPCTEQPQRRPADHVPLEIERVVDRGVRGEEALSGGDGLEVLLYSAWSGQAQDLGLNVDGPGSRGSRFSSGSAHRPSQYGIRQVGRNHLHHDLTAKPRSKASTVSPHPSSREGPGSTDAQRSVALRQIKPQLGVMPLRPLWSTEIPFHRPKGDAL